MPDEPAGLPEPDRPLAPIGGAFKGAGDQALEIARRSDSTLESAAGYGSAGFMFLVDFIAGPIFNAPNNAETAGEYVGRATQQEDLGDALMDLQKAKFEAEQAELAVASLFLPFLGAESSAAARTKDALSASRSSLIRDASDKFRRQAERVAERPGYHDVIVYGDKHSFYLADAERARALSPEALAQMVKADFSYVPGTPIRLLACEAGACGGTAAQGFANAMGVEVLGATEMVYVTRGTTPQLFVAAEMTIAPGVVGPDLSRLGRFKPFFPR